MGQRHHPLYGPCNTKDGGECSLCNSTLDRYAAMEEMFSERLIARLQELAEDYREAVLAADCHEVERPCS